MLQAVSLLSLLLGLMGCALAGLNIWPSFHVALSNASVFVDFSTKSNSSLIRQMSLSLINMDTNSTLLTRTLPNNQSAGRVEFNCSCFLYAGTFRFLLRQSSTLEMDSNATGRLENTWWWSSELQVQWPTFHIAVERDANNTGSFQIGISTNEYFQPCSVILDPALLLEVSYMEYNQIGRKGINKVQARTQHPIKLLRSQMIKLPCAFPFMERDFIQVALRSVHSSQEVKSSGPLYLSQIFSYKLLVGNMNAYRSGCEGTVSVTLVTPPCAHINGKVLLYKDAVVGRGVAVSSGMGAGGTAVLGFGQEEPSSPPLAFNWLTQGENETEFNCSVFYPGRSKYCFRFVFNYSRSPSPAQTCLVVHRSEEFWGPWKQWSVCSVSCGEGVRERVRECLLPSGVEGKHCTGMVKEQSICSLEDCAVFPGPSPSLPPVLAGVVPLGGNMVVVAGISLCLAVILATIVITVWRKLCRTPQCSSVRRGSMHSPGGRKLSDEASICGNSLQRPSFVDSPGQAVPAGVDRGSVPQTITHLSQDPERLSPTGQKVLPPIFGYRLAQQQLKEMKKKGLKEATQVYHVSSSPVHDTMVGTSTSPSSSVIPTSTGLPCLHGEQNQSFSELPLQASRITREPLTPRVELILGPPVSGHVNEGSSRWLNRTADWVEMVQKSGLVGNSSQKNPHFRRTSSFTDAKPQISSSGHCGAFRERSMTQVGSRTLPEGNSWTKERRERPSFSSYPIPEHDTPKWTHPRAQGCNQRKPWIETSIPSHTNEVKHAGTNTSEEHLDCSGTTEGHMGISGIGGPATSPTSPHGVNLLSVERAEQNWNRRGPSPIQRNMLARKLKEAQSCSGAKGRQRSSTFSVSSLEHRKDQCHSLPGSGGCASGERSAYRLSGVEERMMDLDLSSGKHFTRSIPGSCPECQGQRPGSDSGVNGSVAKMDDAKVEIDDGRDDAVEADTLYQNIRKKITPFVMSFGFRSVSFGILQVLVLVYFAGSYLLFSFFLSVFGVVLILVDIVLVIVDISLPARSREVGNSLETVSLIISFFFLADVLLRIYVEGFKVYFGSKLNIIDACVVVVTLVVTMSYTFTDLSGASLIPRVVTFLRFLRIIILVRVFRLAAQKKVLEKVTRRMVSENKRRYQKDGFDLDLTYVTDRVIAMSFPSSGKQSFYRNPIREVARFLDTKHEGHYRVYNLCSEKGYDPQFFHYRVERVFIDDHNVPSLEDMLKYTASVREWMSADPKNVIAIHCKGGKGRTGTLVCTWLIDSDQFENAQDSLEYFGERRTDKSQSSKFQGVETPSQSRYVGYYEVMKTKFNRQLPPPKSLRMKSIRIHSIAGVGRGDGSDLKVKIIVRKELVFECVCATQHNCSVFPDVGNNAAIISLPNGPVVQGDVKVMFESSAGIPKGYEDVPFYFWFNTSFILDNKLFLPREELDNPHKPKTWGLYKEDFGVTLSFSDN
uniref:putative tyrosine-protein phosphatase TPTE n=1 Tax=Doryrhamphus excisus TaxID=161450 RepID=UPI0025ADDFA6|nr:putative tyrosine-protein phosphatase TPTE [Doryrhamphus excisus]